MRRAAVVAAVSLLLGAGCGGEDEPDFRSAASAACRDFDREIRDPEPSADQAEDAYAALADRLEDLRPPQDLRVAHGAMVGFARGGEAVLSGNRVPGDGGQPDARQLAALEDALPACAETVATHPEIQIIR